MSEPKTISIIVPVFNEAPNLKTLHREVSSAISKLPYNFEILFVDDGSIDNSAAILFNIANNCTNVRVLQFARNFGKEAAISAGLHVAKGDAALMIDADMQMPPHLVGEFLKKWESGAEVVVGVFSARSMQWTRLMGAKVFYRIMHVIGSTKITPHATDYRLLDRQVIDVFNELPERNRITRGLIDWLGFKRDYVYFEQSPRLYGKPSYSLRKLFTLAMNSFTSYSLVPLKIAGWLGILILMLSIPATVSLFVMRFILKNPLNWTINSTTFLAMLLLFLVGIVLACLGLISLYIAHIHTEVIGRPLYIIRSKPHIIAIEDASLAE